MANEQDKGNKITTIVVVAVVIILAGICISITHQENKEFDKVGQMLCQEKGYNFWYASGSTIRCYTQDNETGIKKGYDFWVNRELAKQVYLGGQ